MASALFSLLKRGWLAMISLILRPVRQLAQALVANDSPRQIAGAVTLGLLIGLVPKENLTAVLLGMLLLGLRVNKSAGLMAAGVFSAFAVLLDPLAHRLGSFVLTGPSLRELHTQLYASAVSPWLGLNNTVVVGQLLLGLLLSYPVYRCSLQITTRLQAPFSRWLMQYRIVRWLRGMEWGSQWGIDA